MELEHRFEVPVGIEQAWPSLLDMSQVAQCFPGATLSSADGDVYSGSVKVKLGPIQLTYQGKARIVEADESAHRAVIEASGAASRSSSTATMKVVATASPVDADRTTVDMQTSLTITGRPAQFGRGVMVEVGNKILGQFADCLSSSLAAGPAPDPTTAVGGETAGENAGETAADRDGSGEPDGTPEAASAEPDPADPAAGAASGSAGASAPGGAASDDPAESGPSAPPDATPPAAATESRQTGYTRAPEPIDLLGSAGPSILKRIIPVIAGIIVLIVLRSILRRHGHGQRA